MTTARSLARAQPAAVEPQPLDRVFAVHQRARLEVTTLWSDDATVILQLVGELNAGSAKLLPSVTALVITRGARRVYLDLSRLDGCNSAGIRAIVRARGVALRGRCRLTLIGVQTQLARTFEITALDRTLNIE